MPNAQGQAQECPGPLLRSAAGLGYCDIRPGDGATIAKGQLFKAHYTARLASSGKVFDSSYSRGSPLIVKAGECEAIAAWDDAVLGAEGIQPMREGGLRRLVVPPGRLQKAGTKSLLWVVGLSEALEEAGEKFEDGKIASDLIFDLEIVPKRKR